MIDTRMILRNTAAMMALSADPLMGHMPDARRAWRVSWEAKKPSGKNRDKVKAARKQRKSKP